MTLTLGELASALGLAFGLLGMILAALLSRGNPGATFGGGGVGAFLGFMLALRMADDEGAAKVVPTVTKTYNYTYTYFTHTDWAWIICAPTVALIVVLGALAAYWMRLRYGGRPDRFSQQIQHHPRRELTVVKSLPPAKRNPFEDWGRP
jgi:hypothetical protein